MLGEMWRKQYEWRQTHGGRPQDDWSAYDGEQVIGRIWREYKVSSKQGLFGWEGWKTASGQSADSGWEASHRKAVKAVEDAYQSDLSDRQPKQQR